MFTEYIMKQAKPLTEEDLDKVESVGTYEVKIDTEEIKPEYIATKIEVDNKDDPR